MIKGIIEGVKANRKAIVKNALIGVGTIVGLAIVATVVKSKTSENEEVPEVEAEESSEPEADEQ
ncbi:MAG: hypothetical protein N2317_08605 [Syntrophales bacterium]|nr:hypothetical protein [Syntrophales bacterium]